MVFKHLARAFYPLNLVINTLEQLEKKRHLEQLKDRYITAERVCQMKCGHTNTANSTS